jgi:ubiquinone/menaquinone biosynthesis C-methylase UbiE
MTLDAHFAGSIPAIYDDCLVPVLFAPFAEDLVRRAAGYAPEAVLELAAGTGAVSHALAAALTEARIIATDLNPAMLAIADQGGRAANLSFQVADAQALPFADASFDLILAQFGAMFFPDKIAAYREALRVLTPGGTLLFNVWDRLDANSGSAAIHDAIRRTVPEPKPDFIARTPFGYNDPASIEQELHSAGFGQVTIERVARTSPSGSAAALARGMCLGSPLANELAAHPMPVREQALAAAIAAAEAEEAIGPLSMAALVVCATA